MKKIILILLAAVSFSAAQKVVLQLSWLNQFQFAGYYVAKEKGFYRDVGLDVDIKEFQNDTDLSSVIQKGKADFAVGRSSLLIDKINGKDVVALGSIFQESPLILLTRDDANISSVKDLMHKRIMMTNDAKDTASIMAMLFSNGIAQKDIKIIPHSFNLNDLINKKTDAMASYISNEPIRMEEKGIGYKIFDPKDYGFYFYSDILFTSSKFIKNNPKLTKDFYEASIKGWRYAFDHISQTAEIIHNHYNTQHKTLIELIKEGEVLKHLALKKDTPLGYLDRNQLNDIVKVYKVLGIVTKNIDLDTFIYKYNHPTELAFKLKYRDIWFIGIIFILLLISLNFILLFISLRKRWIHTQSHLKQTIADQKEEIDKQNKIIIVQSKIAAIGEMLSNIAHQWRQPLNVISLSTAKIETALLLGKEMKNEDFLKISNDINLQTEYLSQTIDDFRNYFSPNSENFASFNIKDTIGKVNELTKEVFKSSGIEMIMSMKECVITHNENFLIQALLNIYNNAKDAIIENGTAQRYFFIDLRCDEEKIVITLKDSGGGIDSETIEKIFEPYFTTKYKSKGTGLGLYITYSIITQQLNGTISAHNVKYRYKDHDLSCAEFVITLPIYFS
ncbi:ABC transporter substrate-binding protein [Sulfurimonas sp. HSL-1716]|uniref:ABC transporter substrate-binding protein n=1 Tax=Hydrocurvibacter sulfurireducens TaxID=3131937 RepID=UPI0031F942BF